MQPLITSQTPVVCRRLCWEFIFGVSDQSPLTVEMLRTGESQLRVGRENPQQQHFRTSWVRSAGLDVHNIQQIEWACPPQFMVDPNWKMEAGSESQETHIQRQRESRMAEAIYLHDSDIPANPSVASDALSFDGDDSRVPIVPLEVINDEISPDDDDGPLITLSPTANVEETTTQPLSVPPLGPQVDRDRGPEVGTQPLLHRDDVIGAAVALVALIKSKEPGSQIDLELLIQLLRNPGMLEQLMMEHGLSPNQSSTSAQPQERSSVPVPVPRPTLEVMPARKELNPGSAPLSVPGPNTWSASVPFTCSVMEHGLSANQSSIITSAQPQERSYILVPVPRPNLEVKPARSELVTGSIPLLVPGPKVTEGAHNTWSPSVPFTHSMSQEVKYMIDQIHRDSVSQISESMPVAKATSVPSPSSSISKFDLGKAKKLINEYGGAPLEASYVKPASSSPSAVVIKDSEYYRRLISQHGTTQEGSVKRAGESGPQEARLCVYFNSPRGCRHGSSCRFQHVKVNMKGGSRAVDELSAKRMKPSGGNFAKHR